MTNQPPRHETFRVYHDGFKSIIGSHPTVEVIAQNDDYPFAHEAGVYVDSTKELFITSNQYTDATGQRKVQICKVSLGDGTKTTTTEEIQCNLIAMGNGGVNYGTGILFCAQGSLTQPSGLFKMQPYPPYHTEPVLTSYFGRPFNAVNDVVVHPDGSIWFTDPWYGYDQGYRPKPSLPQLVYRYDPSNQSLRAMAGDFGRPNGICFSPDYKVVYVTDTDQVHGSSIDYGRNASIYAFDIAHYHGQPSLVNRRLFAVADTGIPDGIKCDTMGNVYSGCGDGVNVWSAGGILLGKLLVEGGAANLCFGRDGQLFVLNEHRLWRFQLDVSVKGALLGI